MIETFVALLFAHMLADYTFQTNWIAAGKKSRNARALSWHAAIVLGTAHVAMGHFWCPWVLGLTVAHIAMDYLKSYLPDDKLWPFMLDQLTHVLVILTVAALAPDMWANGFWASAPWLPPLMLLVAGAIATTQAGGYAVGLLLSPFAQEDAEEGLKDAGRLIGLLERGMIYVLVLVGQPAGIGFLIAAKSILRFESATKAKNQKAASEYIIIGTLASFGWALGMAWVILTLMAQLAPIGIPALSP